MFKHIAAFRSIKQDDAKNGSVTYYCVFNDNFYEAVSVLAYLMSTNISRIVDTTDADNCTCTPDFSSTPIELTSSSTEAIDNETIYAAMNQNNTLFNVCQNRTNNCYLDVAVTWPFYAVILIQFALLLMCAGYLMRIKFCGDQHKNQRRQSEVTESGLGEKDNEAEFEMVENDMYGVIQ
jgi:hypothetical protein